LFAAKIYSGNFEGASSDGKAIATDSTIASLNSSMSYPLRYGYCLVGRVSDVGAHSTMSGNVGRLSPPPLSLFFGVVNVQSCHNNNNSWYTCVLISTSCFFFYCA
jgi:hypothetical protein